MSWFAVVVGLVMALWVIAGVFAVTTARAVKQEVSGRFPEVEYQNMNRKGDA